MHLMQICLDLFPNSFHAVVPVFALSIADPLFMLEYITSYPTCRFICLFMVYSYACVHVLVHVFFSFLQVTNDTATEVTANSSSRRVLAETVRPCQECMVPSDATSLQSLS